MNQTDIDRIFDSHPPRDITDEVNQAAVTAAFKRIAVAMSNLPPGREQSIVMTKLEEASFFAHAAIARGIG